MCTDVFHLGSQHQGPFWLPMILFVVKKKKKCGVMAVMMKLGPFVLTFGIKMCTWDGMGISWWEPHIDWGADEAEMATNAHRGMRG